MSRIKIAFFDIDGTIIPIGTGKVPPRAEETLFALQKAGILVCIATGPGPMTLPHFPRFRFDVHLTFNGSLCYNDREEIYSNPLAHDEVMQVLANTQKMGRPISIAGRSYCVGNGSSPDLQQYFDIAHEELKIDPHFSEKISGEVYQIMLACTPEEYDEVLKGTVNTKPAAWWDRAIDLVPADCGKGTGVRKILEYYGFSKDEAIAFGDGGNDIEMFHEVGHSVAMGNAADNVKAEADAVCGSVDDYGACTYCETYLL